MSIVFFIIGGLITFLLDGSWALCFVGGLVAAVLAVCIDMREKVKKLESSKENEKDSK